MIEQGLYGMSEILLARWTRGTETSEARPELWLKEDGKIYWKYAKYNGGEFIMKDVTENTLDDWRAWNQWEDLIYD